MLKIVALVSVLIGLTLAADLCVIDEGQEWGKELIRNMTDAVNKFEKDKGQVMTFLMVIDMLGTDIHCLPYLQFLNQDKVSGTHILLHILVL